MIGDLQLEIYHAGWAVLLGRRTLAVANPPEHLDLSDPAILAAVQRECLLGAEEAIRRQQTAAAVALDEVRGYLRQLGRRLTWTQTEAGHIWDATWGAPPFVIHMAIWHDLSSETYDPTASFHTGPPRDRCEHVVWHPDGLPTLKAAQDACERWLDDWHRASGVRPDGQGR